MKFNWGIIIFLFSGLIRPVPLGEIQASDKEEFRKTGLNGFIDVEGADTQEWVSVDKLNVSKLSVSSGLNFSKHTPSVVKILVAWSSSPAPWHYNHRPPPTLMNPNKLESLVAAVSPQSALEMQSSWQHPPGRVSLSEKCRLPSEARGRRDGARRSDLESIREQMTVCGDIHRQMEMDGEEERSGGEEKENKQIGRWR